MRTIEPEGTMNTVSIHPSVDNGIKPGADDFAGVGRDVLVDAALAAPPGKLGDRPRRAESVGEVRGGVRADPGEGAQYVNMLSDLCRHFPVVRECFDAMDRVLANDPAAPALLAELVA